MNIMSDMVIRFAPRTSMTRLRRYAAPLHRVLNDMQGDVQKQIYFRPGLLIIPENGSLPRCSSSGLTLLS